MNDLVKRLRDYEEELGPQCGAGMVGEAADEIERLRAALGRILKLTQDPRVYPNVAVITLRIEEEAVRALRPADEDK